MHPTEKKLRYQQLVELKRKQQGGAKARTIETLRRVMATDTHAKGARAHKGKDDGLA